LYLFANFFILFFCFCLRTFVLCSKDLFIDSRLNREGFSEEETLPKHKQATSTTPVSNYKGNNKKEQWQKNNQQKFQPTNRQDFARLNLAASQGQATIISARQVILAKRVSCTQTVKSATVASANRRFALTSNLSNLSVQLNVCPDLQVTAKHLSYMSLTVYEIYRDPVFILNANHRLPGPSNCHAN
jgi:hypothetical protein